MFLLLIHFFNIRTISNPLSWFNVLNNNTRKYDLMGWSSKMQLWIWLNIVRTDNVIEQFWEIGNYREHYICWRRSFRELLFSFGSVFFKCFRNINRITRGRFWWDDGVKYAIYHFKEFCNNSKARLRRFYLRSPLYKRFFRVLELCTLSQWPRSPINSSLWNDKSTEKKVSFLG